MEKLAGKIVDFYDDTKGLVLKRRYPTPNDLPDFIKQGALLSEKERGNLRDGLFALVMKNGDEAIRKYACTDDCNTALSVIYLLDHGKEILPEAATKTAAQNLIEACKTYDIKPPLPLEKLAGILPPELTPYIDVTDMEVPTKERPASEHCLTKEAKYPIETYEQVLKAVKFFEKNASKFHPLQRREYSLNLTKRAEELGIPTTMDIRKYAANDYASISQIRGEFALRMEKTASEKDQALYKVLFKKVATTKPGVFANMLTQIDEETGMSERWDRGIMDPFSSVLAEKTASYSFTNSQGYVDEEDLKRLSEYSELLEHAFDKDFTKGFKKNPVDVFKALPEPEKRTVMRLVSAAKKW